VPYLLVEHYRLLDFESARLFRHTELANDNVRRSLHAGQHNRASLRAKQESRLTSSTTHLLSLVCLYAKTDRQTADAQIHFTLCHREEKADLADAIMTVAATALLNDPPSDTCPTPNGPNAEQPNSPRDKAGTSSVSRRASPVIAFGHRVDSPRSGKKSPERGQDADVSLTQSEDVEGVFADEAAAVLKPWLGELLVLALQNPRGFGRSAHGTAQSGEAAEQNGTAEQSGTTERGGWFDTLLDGVSASSRADSGAGKVGAECSGEQRSGSDQEGLDLPQAEGLVGRTTRSTQVNMLSTADAEFRGSGLVTSLFTGTLGNR
jgi:hypothetical protein